MKSGRGNYLLYTGIVTDHFQKKRPDWGVSIIFFNLSSTIIRQEYHQDKNQYPFE